MKKHTAMVVIMACLLIISLSACVSGSNTNTTESDAIEIIYPISDSDFSKIKDEFADGRYGWLVVGYGSGDYENVYAFYDVCMRATFLDDAPVAKIDVYNAANLNALVASFSVQFDSYDDWGFAGPRILTVDATSIKHWYADDYSDLLVIGGNAEDESGTFEFQIATRPWGMKWDDIAESEPNDKPSNYYDWYLPLIEAGKPMPL